MSVSVDEVYALAGVLDGPDAAAAAAAYAQLLAGTAPGARANALVADVLVQHHAAHAAHTAAVAALLVRLARDPLEATRLAALRGLARVCAPAPAPAAASTVPPDVLRAALTALVRAACAVAPAEHTAAAAALAALAPHHAAACAEAAAAAVHAAAAAPPDTPAAAPPVASLVAVVRDSIAPAVLPAVYDGRGAPPRAETSAETDTETARQWAALLLGLLAAEGVGADDARVLLALLLRLPQYAPDTAGSTSAEARAAAEDAAEKAVHTLLRVLLCRAGFVAGDSDSDRDSSSRDDSTRDTVHEVPLHVRTDAEALARAAAWLPLVADVAVGARAATRRDGTATALVAQLYTPALVAACGAAASSSASSSTDPPGAAAVPPACRLPLLRALVDLVPAVRADACRALFPAAVALLAATVPAGAHDLGAGSSTGDSSSAPAVRYTTCECALLLLRRLALRVPAELRRHCGVAVPAAQPGDLAVAADAARYADLRARLAFLRATNDATVAELARTATCRRRSRTGPSADATAVAQRVTASIRSVLAHMLHAAPFVQPRGGSAAAAAAWWQQEQREQQRADAPHALPPSWRMARAPALPVVRTVVLPHTLARAPKVPERADADRSTEKETLHEEHDHGAPPSKRRLSEP